MEFIRICQGNEQNSHRCTLLSSVWAILKSVYSTQKPVHCTQISVYATQKILANFLPNVEFVLGTQNQNSYTFQGFRR